MANSFDVSGRGWSDRQLLLGGAIVLVVIALVTGVLLAKSQGRLDQRVRVRAEMVNVGDGLPERADVKFRGLLVGAVNRVEPAQDGQPNIVHIDLKPEAALGIPNTVTARVVPSNVFAVSSVQLVDHGYGEHLHDGAVLAEDAELPTVLFQNTTDRLRQILAATERSDTDPPVGIMRLAAQATDGRGDELLRSGARLQRILTELNQLVSADPHGPSTVTALNEMTRALNSTAPGLLDSLEQAVVPLRTVAEQEAQLDSLLSAGLRTSGTVSTAINSHIDRLIGITTHLEPVIGVLAMNQDQFVPIATRIRRLSDAVLTQGWNSERQLFAIKVIVSFTPVWTYLRADCPRFGPLKGPSCQSAPDVPARYALPDKLLPESYRPPPDLAPPPDAVLPAPDLIADPDAPAPSPAGVVAPASYGGNVGPVGSPGERDALSAILGGQVSPAQQLLLGPVARGTQVSVSPDPDAAGGS